ncbi:hypothetical protein Trydic_g11288 [Trypoxylus dichotomus]
MDKQLLLDLRCHVTLRISMDNQFLYRSLTQDLRCLNNLAKMMMMSENSVEIYSWLDPRKKFSELDDVNSFCVCDEEGRIKCMELIIDRLYMILNFNVGYLEMPCNMKSKLQKNVEKPKKLTLGLSANLLWDRIQQLALNADVCKLESPMTEKSSASKFNCDHKYVQTSSQSCPTCKIAQECVKLIANDLWKQKKDENVTGAKQDIQDNIYGLTQTASMTILTKAITTDITNMIRDNKDLQTQLEDQKRMYQYLNYNYQDILRRNEEVIQKVQELKKSEKTYSETVTSLQTKLAQLHFEKYHMEKTLDLENEKCVKLEKDMDENKETITVLRAEIQKSQVRIDSLSEKITNINTERELWKIRFSDAHAENKRLQNTSNESKETVAKLEKELKHAMDSVEELSCEVQKVCDDEEKELWKTQYSKIQNENEKLQTLNNELKNIINKLEQELDLAASHFKELDKKVARNYEEIDSNARAYVELLRKTEEVVKSNDKLVDRIDNSSFMSNYNNDDFEVQGDPLYDMMKQVEINKRNMLRLEQQNSMLMSTIKKILVNTEKWYDWHHKIIPCKQVWLQCSLMTSN